MRSRISILIFFLLLLLGQALEEKTALAQVATVSSAAAAPLAAHAAGMDVTVGDALRSLAARAGVVFVGQVAGVKRQGDVVEVSFQVERAVAGDVGATYTLREWAGLWAGGQQRYPVGQRAMFFLYTPQRLPHGGVGFGSSVDGVDGVVPMVPMGADAPALLDVRRLSARVLRAQGQRMVGEAVAMPDAVRVVAAQRAGGPTESEPVAMLLPAGARGGDAR